MRLEVGVRCESLLARNAGQALTEIGLLFDELFVSAQEFPRPSVPADGCRWVCRRGTPIGDLKPTPNATPRMYGAESLTVNDKQ